MSPRPVPTPPPNGAVILRSGDVVTSGSRVLAYVERAWRPVRVSPRIGENINPRTVPVAWEVDDTPHGRRWQRLPVDRIAITAETEQSYPGAQDLA